MLVSDTEIARRRAAAHIGRASAGELTERSWAGVFVIVVAWALLNFQFLRGHAYIPWDSLDEFFPQVKFVVSSIRAGQAPWWNPFIYGGQPVLGDPQGMIFTLHTLVGVLTGPLFDLRLFDITTVAMELLGALALARYARQYSGNPFTPILGAVVFLAGGVATSRLEHVPQIVAYGLLPIQLLALRATCHKPTALRSTALACALAAGLLNPNQVVFLSALGLAPFAVLHLYETPRRGWAILASAYAGALALLIDAPALSAIGEFVKVSNRAALGLDASAGSSLPLFDAASVYLPGLFGVHGRQSGLWAPTDISQDYLYIGIVPMVVAIVATFQRRRAPAIPLICIGSAVWWFVFSMGVNTPVYGFLFHHLPGLSAFRRPADGAYFLNLCVALWLATSPTFQRARVPRAGTCVVIAALWLLALGTPFVLLMRHASAIGHVGDLLVVCRSFGNRFAALLLVLVVLYACRRFVAPKWAGLLLIVLTVVDLVTVGRISGVYVPVLRDNAQAIAYVNRNVSGAQALPLDQTIDFLATHGATGFNPSVRMEALGGSLGASMPMAFRVLSTQGYSPITLRSYNDLIGAQNLQSAPKQFTSVSPSYDSPAYQRLSLRYVLIDRETLTRSANFGEIGATAKRVRAGLSDSGWARPLEVPGAYEIWELQNARPRATAVAPDGTESACDVISYENTKVSVRCQAAQARRVVLGDVYAPGWMSCVDGKPVDTQPFDGVFRSAVVQNGNAIVTFRYRPVPFLRSTSCD
ncbi:hypothetical protein BZM27_05375 [Paraburkholderia steynii]|uniref:YfhO family protein n=1 Tax=Paraburkholderia steynii TaxID=1245441 RepID=A0A4R0XGP6_9BURK|nr:hypothetical protein BZM27_05375 [Paraburkholderia steynii]